MADNLQHLLDSAMTEEFFPLNFQVQFCLYFLYGLFGFQFGQYGQGNNGLYISLIFLTLTDELSNIDFSFVYFDC